MKIAVVGAGAMGGLFGGRLATAGEDVVLVDVSEAHLRVLRERGLRLDTDDGERTVPVPAGRPEEVSGIRDLLIVFTKGPATEAAVRGVAHLHGPDTRVLTVQNGLGNVERIRAALPGARVLWGMTNWPADLAGPGHVRSHGHGEVRIWSAPGDQPDPVFHQVAATLSAAGLQCVADPAVEVAVWEKVAFNTAMNSVCAATRLPVGPVGDSPDARALVRTVVDEVLAVARACNVPVDPARVHDATAKAFAGHRDHMASMLQDVLAGRQTEVESINGAVVAAGEEAGVPTPATRVLRDLLRVVDSARDV